MIGIEAIVPLDQTDQVAMREVAELAAAANVVMVECAGEIRFCGVDQVPAGWHRVGVSG